MAHAALERRISVTESGAKRTMTVREVAYHRLAEKAVAGDIKALAYLLSLEEHGEQAESDVLEVTPSSDQDLQIIQDFLARQRFSKESEK
jgi:hypothetical protein